MLTRTGPLRRRKKFLSGPDRHDPERRFLTSIKLGTVPRVRPDLGACLIFVGAGNGNGYREFRYDGRNGYAHRYAWERVNGPIPDDLTVDHLCEVRRCVNVDHLVLATAVDNYLRTKLAIAHCPNGHPYTDGIRRCPICKKATSAREAKRRARLANGLPDRRRRYDKTAVNEAVIAIIEDRSTIAIAAREIGCNPGYLGRRAWTEARRRALSRDAYLCVRCSAPAEDVHHRVPRGSGGSSRPSISFGLANLVSLCRACHTWVHVNVAAAYLTGLLLRRTQDPAAEPVQIAQREAGEPRWFLQDARGGRTPATEESK